jgi:polar amino acid transport system substrate-binding protein
MKHLIARVLLLSWFLGVGLTQASADTIAFAFKTGKEPYVLASIPPKPRDYILENDLGIEIEIVKEAFAYVGKEIRPVYMNYDRMTKEIAAGTIDGAGQLVPNLEGVHYMDKYAHLHDHLIFNAKLGSNIKGVNDLAGKRVIAFQQASKYLGAEYNAATKTFSSYKEMVKQKNQSLLLIKGRTDAIILDIGIFKHWAKTLAKPDDTFVYIPLAPEPFFFSAGFKDAALRNLFAEGMKKLRDSGRYDAIYKKYLD